MSLFLGNSQIFWFQLFECDDENKTFKASPRALGNRNDQETCRPQGPGNRTTNLPISGQSALPPDLLLPSQ